ncbi:palmitoyltransferase ZDHHC4-like isoform X2 [Ptychodera flava]
MDFLTLVAVYSGVFAVLCYILFFGDSQYHRHGYVGKLRENMVRFFMWWPEHCLPSPVYHQSRHLLIKILYTKNCVIQVLYLILAIGAYAEFTVDVLPIALTYKFGFKMTVGPYLVLAANLYFFFKCYFTDPGVISTSNHDRYADVYGYDCVLYKPNNVCKTCKFVKPARSKHCAICDHCVYRFDHHCSWVNNCIGGANIYYFIGYLVTISIGCIYITYISTWALKYIVILSGLHTARYIGADGQPHPITFPVMFQHLFLQHPRLVFLVTSFFLLFFLIGGFSCYHLYLAATNQTTNERWKSLPKESQNQRKTANYSRGILSNFGEVIWPTISRKRKKRK